MREAFSVLATHDMEATLVAWVEMRVAYDELNEHVSLTTVLVAPGRR